MLSDQIEAMQRVCFGAEPSQADLEALGSRERWLVYRELVRNRLRQVVSAALPRTKAVLGSAAFDASVDAWLATGGPDTRYFRHVPRALCRHELARWRQAEPEWLGDLAQYEITCWDVRYAPSLDIEVGDFAFDRVPVLNPALALLHLDYPVHRVPTPAEGYPARQTALCVYRSKDHKPVPWVLNPLAASLVETWARADATVTDTVHAVAKAHDAEIGPAFVDKLSSMIADFLTRGILMGAVDPSR